MLVAACVLPHPPVLVPEVAVRSPGWLEELRKVCLDAVRGALASAPDRVVIVGAADRDDQWDQGAGGSLAAYGVDIAFGGPTAELPLSLTIAAYLLDAAGWQGSRTYVASSRRTSDVRAAELGRELVAEQATVLLVMGDASAKRSKRAPGYLDERAEGFDASVAAALADADASALAALDPRLADDLWVAGLPAWQVLAGALDGDYVTRVEYDDAPAGVGYLVVSLTLR